MREEREFAARTERCAGVTADGNVGESPRSDPQLLEAIDARLALLNHARPGRGRWSPNWGDKGRAPSRRPFPWDDPSGSSPTLRSRCADVPDPVCFDWRLAPWPSFAPVEESGRDRFAEAALGLEAFAETAVL